MASRHPIPEIPLSDVGSDERNVIPRFPDPVVVEFSGGKALGEFVEVISACKSSRVEAAAGAGKSVRMPTALFKTTGGVFVHCVPSKPLAVSLHDYVASISDPDIPVSLCVEEALDEYPTSGLVFTYSASFLAQVLRWKARGEDPNVLLYMDECHESDGSTATIRKLRHGLHGVGRYAESSATHGSGDVSTSFATARLPASVTEIKAHMPPPAEWDMTATGVPWSLRKLTGDIVVFTDDEQEAGVVMRKFMESGLRTHRMTGHTSVDEYRRVMGSLNGTGDGVVSVLVLDYTFRSGFSFPTVDRIIDLSRVRFFVNHGGKTVAQYRQPYNAEVYQTKNRGGRIKGRNCNYFRLQFEPQNIQVFLEGAEAMIACLWYRMLGYDPDAMLSGTPMYKGDVPRNFLAAMRGRLLMSCYALDTPWPGKSVEVKPSPPAEPVVLMTPELGGEAGAADAKGLGIDSAAVLDDLMKSPVVDLGTYGGFLGRPPSVFSIDSDGDEGVLSEEAFREAHRKSVANQRVRTEKHVPPLPSMDNTYKVVQGMSGLRDTVRERRVSLEIGKYYRLHGFEGEIRTAYFPDGVYGVSNAAGEMAIDRFVKSLAPDAALEARQRALLDVNRATVKYSAVSTVMTGVQKQRDKFQVLDSDAMRQWLEMMRDLLLGADVTIRQGFKVLETTGVGDILPISGASFVADEKDYVQCVLNVLRVCVSIQSGENVLPPVSDEVDEVYMTEVLEQTANYASLSGRVNMRISGKSLRERIAKRILGNKPVQVDSILAN